MASAARRHTEEEQQVAAKRATARAQEQHEQGLKTDHSTDMRHIPLGVLPSLCAVSDTERGDGGSRTAEEARVKGARQEEAH
eukprot:1179482-Rhodomonas_salina.1